MATNQMLRVADYRSLLERMLRDYGLPTETLEIVPSIQEWCQAAFKGSELLNKLKGS